MQGHFRTVKCRLLSQKDAFERLKVALRMPYVSYAHFQRVLNDAMEGSFHFTPQIVPKPPIRRKVGKQMGPMDSRNIKNDELRSRIMRCISVRRPCPSS